MASLGIPNLGSNSANEEHEPPDHVCIDEPDHSADPDPVNKYRNPATSGIEGEGDATWLRSETITIYC